MDVKHRELSQAASVDEIVRVTRDYLRSVRPHFDSLPANCRPAPVQGPEDIEYWADRLNEASRKTPLLEGEERRLDRLASHFLIASVLMRQLEATPR